MENSALENLQLQGNPFQNVPAEIGNLTHLRILNISRTNIETLPQSIEKLQNLAELYLTEIPLQILPVEITSLSNLRFLSLEDTEIDSKEAQNKNILKQLKSTGCKIIR